ncbi:MAG: GTPase HflX [Flavobacteriaceae bacterium]|nr:GTPase HflX [Flavobacteriaceae bacterium]MCY4267787.1 GTPase HflX [Flavobacteriaceae bacterium]
MIESHAIPLERVVLVGVVHADLDVETANEHLAELAFLTQTASGVVIKTFMQRIRAFHPKTLVGQGKMLEIQSYTQANDIGTVIFDCELTPTQQANIERVLRCKILDRTALILDIFALKAKTSYAKTQVELAQYEYLLPRLKGLWTHLERQRGGIGVRGPGETEIETDRRIVRNKISLLKKRLESIQKQKTTQRSNRKSLVRVALVGYTNVGKSTLMNLLSKSKVMTEDKLFATLDTTVRKVVFTDMPFLLVDTVGFIRKLPTQLIESFKSTLDEVVQADLLIHLVDISNSNFEKHMDSVNQILWELQSIQKPTLMVFNKIDAYQPQPWDQEDLRMTRGKEHFSIQEWKQTWMQKNNQKAIFISASKKINIQSLKHEMERWVGQIYQNRFPYRIKNIATKVKEKVSS